MSSEDETLKRRIKEDNLFFQKLEELAQRAESIEIERRDKEIARIIAEHPEEVRELRRDISSLFRRYKGQSRTDALNTADGWIYRTLLEGLKTRESGF